MLGKQTI